MCATGRPNIVFAMMDQLKTSKYILAVLNQTFDNTQKMKRKTIKDAIFDIKIILLFWMDKIYM